MKQIQSLLLVSIIISGMGLFSCKDGCKDTNYLPDNFKKYWCFNVGSRWIYQLNDSTSIFDTVVLVSKVTEPQHPSIEESEKWPCTEWVVIALEHSDTSFYNVSPTYPEVRIESYDNWDGIIGLSSDFYGLPSYGCFLFYSLESNTLVQSTNPSQSNMVGIVTLSTPAGTFNDVVHYCLYESMDLYLAPGVGIVQIKTTNGQVWKLVSVNIN